MSECACGIPNQADWYLFLIIVRGDDATDYADVYLCDEHLPTEDHYADVLKFDGHEEWDILEVRLSELDRTEVKIK